MQGYNLIAVFNKAADRLLMCRRKKEPYKGLSNFVGGKIKNLRRLRLRLHFFTCLQIRQKVDGMG